MTPDEYLNQLKKGLTNFSDEDRDDLLAEIESHIESAGQDPQMENDPPEREQRLMDELGSPDDLAKGFHSVYRPAGWIDYLLVVVPEFILFPLLGNYFTAINGEWPGNVWLTGRAGIVLSALLVLVGVRRRSVGLVLFWLPVTVADIVSLMTREQRWGIFSSGLASPAGATAHAIESLIWYLLLLITLYWLGKVLWKQRTHLLLLTFALQPLLLAGANYATVLIQTSTHLTIHFPYWAVGPISLFKWAELIWPGLFFIAKNRRLRWLGVALGAANMGVYNLMAGWDSALVVIIWILFCGVVALGWGLDERDRKRFDRTGVSVQ